MSDPGQLSVETGWLPETPRHQCDGPHVHTRPGRTRRRDSRARSVVGWTTRLADRHKEASLGSLRIRHHVCVDELARWAETVGGGPPRDWVLVDDPALTEAFVRAYTKRLGRAASAELPRIERADGAVRVSYSGGALVMSDPNGDDLDLFEAVTDAALALAQIEHDNDYC
jgi:hypothetical protein